MRTLAIYGLGVVGAQLALTLANQVDELLLLDPDEQRAVAVANDLQSAGLALPAKQIKAQAWADLKRAQVLVVALGPAEVVQPDLSAVVAAVRVAAPQVQAADFTGVVINLTQPNEATTAWLQATWQLPSQRVLGSGTLVDTQQLHQAVAAALHLAPASVTGYVYGQHAGQIVPAWSTIHVDGRPLSALPGGHFDQQQVQTNARLMAYYVTRGQAGQLAAQTAANRLLGAIFQDQQLVVPAAVFHPQYGGYVSFPVRVGRQGVGTYLLLDLYPVEQAQVQVAAEAIATQVAGLQQLSREQP